MSEPPPVAVVRVEPLGVSVEVRQGESLMRAAERQGLWWPTLCHGQAECTACWIDASGLDAFEPASALEESGLRLFEGRTFFDGKDVRLACQARPVRDTVVVKRGVRRRS
jgi:2Fe-2S ferredoxin